MIRVVDGMDWKTLLENFNLTTLKVVSYNDKEYENRTLISTIKLEVLFLPSLKKKKKGHLSSTFFWHPSTEMFLSIFFLST